MLGTCHYVHSRGGCIGTVCTVFPGEACVSSGMTRSDAHALVICSIAVLESHSTFHRASVRSTRRVPAKLPGSSRGRHNSIRHPRLPPHACPHLHFNVIGLNMLLTMTTGNCRPVRISVVLVPALMRCIAMPARGDGSRPRAAAALAPAAPQAAVDAAPLPHDDDAWYGAGE